MRPVTSVQACFIKGSVWNGLLTFVLKRVKHGSPLASIGISFSSLSVEDQLAVLVSLAYQSLGKPEKSVPLKLYQKYLFCRETFCNRTIEITTKKGQVSLPLLLMLFSLSGNE
jgi:hypothetical protein